VVRFFTGAVVWRRFWRPAAARTEGPCGQPLFSAAKGVQEYYNGGKCERSSNSVSECGAPAGLVGSIVLRATFSPAIHTHGVWCTPGSWVGQIVTFFAYRPPSRPL
jgi:hypothetical protein